MTSDYEENDAPHLSPFEAIRQINDDRIEFWSARDLAKILQYDNYRNFLKVVAKARIACEQSGQAITDHFVEADEMVSIGSGAKRKITDVNLSRYACYLIVQNAGVILPIDFAIFQDHGYIGLYGGLKAKDIHARKELEEGQEILDYMGSDELAANIFRASLTKQKLEREQIKGKVKANHAHNEMGRAVRETIIKTGATVPEDLPTPTKSIQQLEQNERKRLKQGPQLAMFEELEDSATTEE